MRRIGLWGAIATFVLVFAGTFVSFYWLPSAQLNAPSNRVLVHSAWRSGSLRRLAALVTSFALRTLDF